MSATCIFEGAREASITLINIAAFSETEPARKKTQKKHKKNGEKQKKKAASASGVSAYLNLQLQRI